MGTDSQLQELQKEWRESTSRKLDYLTEKIDGLPSLFANQLEFKTLKNEVEELKTFRNKALGGILVFNFLIALIGYLIGHH